VTLRTPLQELSVTTGVTTLTPEATPEG
jgi:hypothetical protein